MTVGFCHVRVKQVYWKRKTSNSCWNVLFNCGIFMCHVHIYLAVSDLTRSFFLCFAVDDLSSFLMFNFPSIRCHGT